ncbi:related to glycosyl hydrolase [Cephalotrichum gorgonifer]|uniref:Related to glycosyl hydrolase n=1 Tax=Cephalotrichum gorgonifer TaxID=2041049 RepID=A0AAE8SZY4_9PEZI|nr:related to glycosyl hydrolase [Cephalotrichum gorgonifer]
MIENLAPGFVPGRSWALWHDFWNDSKKPVLDSQDCEPDIPSSFVRDGIVARDGNTGEVNPLEMAYNALVTMQREFWDPQSKTWPTAIDWTAAFIHTAFTGMTDTLSMASDESFANMNEDEVLKTVETYFNQIVDFYSGQNAASLRGQAFDDMLWVVLGWLESTSFIKSHSDLHYSGDDDRVSSRLRRRIALVSRAWQQGNEWMGAFGLRAREFWDLARVGWGEDLCGGGMRWSPHLLVYKNAITNQLWIASSAKIYIDFPVENIEARNQTYLEVAMKGYDWIMAVNMTNKAGLFVDGYHISNPPADNTKCDTRDESVYTYNQGVLLTGQRRLWEATGSPDFLRDGHQLTQDVIQATGWDLREGSPTDEIQPDKLPPWRGLGRAGVIEERCDSTGDCSQNTQTFKGIYFHHLTEFCMPITRPNQDVDDKAFDAVVERHANACRAYLPWIAHNAEAALGTRDERGVFGGWWGADKYQVWDSDGARYRSQNVSDYRNFGIPDNDVWRAAGEKPAPLPGVEARDVEEPLSRDARNSGRRGLGSTEAQQEKRKNKARAEDPNDRGRGRTVETQNSGMSVLRAWWEISQAHA